MQAYSAGFARVYNQHWGGFAKRIAPLILAYYQGMPISQRNPAVLDLCCGTGQLATYFLEQGYHVIGIDSSPAMLRYAAENTADYVQSGRAAYMQADAANFALSQRVGLVVSTYDALNHIESDAALGRCFRCVLAALDEGGVFIFDLNTRLGLSNWTNIIVEDTPDLMIVTRGIYDEPARRATTRISGFIRNADGFYDRFEETAYNTVFDLAVVRTMLLEAGWRAMHFATSQDLATPLPEPEDERRVFIIAQR
jgi:SAM-dependent methyltransferase